ncbi:YybH family protein [Candidatus Zixiibacteriota bacterium]
MLKFFFVILVTSIIIISCKYTPRVDIEAEVAEINKLDSLWQEAMNAKDSEKTASFFSADGLMMPSNSPAIKGHEKIKEYFDAWLPDTNVISTFTPKIIEVAASGDLAYDQGTYHFEMKTADGTLKVDGKYIIIWQKINGEWKAIADISNSDV